MSSAIHQFGAIGGRRQGGGRAGAGHGGRCAWTAASSGLNLLLLFISRKLYRVLLVLNLK